MKKIVIVVMLCLISCPSFADPFMGEGKQNYIKRCKNSAEIPNFSKKQIDKMCECLADEQEIRWYDLISSVKPNESPYELQQKANTMMQKISEECYIKIK